MQWLESGKVFQLIFFFFFDNFENPATGFIHSQ
jgi:hypothetical protein